MSEKEEEVTKASEEETAAEESAEAAADSESDSENEASASSEDTESAEAESAKPARAASSNAEGGSSAWIGYAGMGLIVAGSIAWLANGPKDILGQAIEAPAAPAEAAASEDAAPKGPCEQWRNEMCEAVGGAQAAACQQVGAASDLLSEQSCKRELKQLAATVKNIKAKRADCETLQQKLCTDLGAESEGCQMATKKTPSIPAKGCSDMLNNKYDKVLASLQKRGSRGGSPHGRPNPHGHGAPGKKGSVALTPASVKAGGKSPKDATKPSVEVKPKPAVGVEPKKPATPPVEKK